MDAVWKSEVDKRLNEIERKQAIHDTKIDAIEKKMDKIEGNTTWILRIVVTAVVGAVLKLVLTGGI